MGISARREDRLAEVLGDLPGGKSWTVDLADLDGIDAFAARADAEMGGIDVLVNNAGIPKRRRTTTMTADDAESVMAMNYFSPVRLTLALLPRMIERGRGDIVNVSSMGVHLVAFGVGAYSASKAALELFTESLYVELPGTGVRAHLVVPGTTLTEFCTPREERHRRCHPGRRRPHPRRWRRRSWRASSRTSSCPTRPGRCRHLSHQSRRPEHVPRADARRPRRPPRQLAQVDQEMQ